MLTKGTYGRSMTTYRVQQLGVTRQQVKKRQSMIINQASQIQPFHLAILVNDLEVARHFYGTLLGCEEGRSASTWIDFNLFGHQLVCHYVSNYNASSVANEVDGDPVPVPHFGIALTVEQFHGFADLLKQNKIDFKIQPHLRFVGQPGEQWTMFFKDPSGNALEFKAMTTLENLFAKYFVS
eukprot:TRINITY_DN11071_c0_g1_i1.p1 TRINITY_DN11071_c0_g1~~TRINITY_DN11071_c0_g1_i1.p1  ORF type:complete len:181 (-),score=16.19 TRINITY_DN11071_c0_g1_i1:225-767(-)